MAWYGHRAIQRHFVRRFFIWAAERLFNVLRGNNVVSFIDKIPNTTPQTGNSLAFKYSYDTTKEPTAGQNPDAAKVNAFYVINKIHDIAYRYGFTEKAFNFQMNNFNKGGAAGDPVFMSVQNSTKYNNADFGTGPE